MDLIFGTNGINLIIDWKQIGITALQLIDITIWGLARSWEFFNGLIRDAIELWNTFKDSVNEWNQSAGAALFVGVPDPYAPGGAAGRAAGGSASGLTWVGERGPELLNLPNGSYVNNNQASQSMGFDYYKLAAILAVEFAKVRD